MTDDDLQQERQEARERRLRSTIGRARLAARTVDGERLMFTVGTILVPLGLLLIGVAWKGVANTGAVFEQLPFVVSGGLGGLALVVLGGFLYFGWWQTRALREARDHATRSQELAESTLLALEALTRSHEALVAELSTKPARRPNGSRAAR